MKISVYDSITEYTFPAGTSYNLQERTSRIFARLRNDGNTLTNLYSFFHRITSTHQSVSSGGNEHTSIFFIIIGTSTTIKCSSDPITSLNSDLMLRWVYFKVERDMWSNDYTIRFRTSLMGSECVETIAGGGQFELRASDVFILGPGKEDTAGKRRMPRVFYYKIENVREGSGGDIFMDGSSEGKLKPMN